LTSFQGPSVKFPGLVDRVCAYMERVAWICPQTAFTAKLYFPGILSLELAVGVNAKQDRVVDVEHCDACDRFSYRKCEWTREDAVKFDPHLDREDLETENITFCHTAYSLPLHWPHPCHCGLQWSGAIYS